MINGRFAEPDGPPDSHERNQPGHAPVVKLPGFDAQIIRGFLFGQEVVIPLQAARDFGGLFVHDVSFAESPGLLNLFRGCESGVQLLQRVGR